MRDIEREGIEKVAPKSISGQGRGDLEAEERNKELT